MVLLTVTVTWTCRWYSIFLIAYCYLDCHNFRSVNVKLPAFRDLRDYHVYLGRNVTSHIRVIPGATLRKTPVQVLLQSTKFAFRFENFRLYPASNFRSNVGTKAQNKCCSTRFLLVFFEIKDEGQTQQQLAKQKIQLGFLLTIRPSRSSGKQTPQKRKNETIIPSFLLQKLTFNDGWIRCTRKFLYHSHCLLRWLCGRLVIGIGIYFF